DGAGIEVPLIVADPHPWPRGSLTIRWRQRFYPSKSRDGLPTSIRYRNRPSAQILPAVSSLRPARRGDRRAGTGTVCPGMILETRRLTAGLGGLPAGGKERADNGLGLMSFSSYGSDYKRLVGFFGRVAVCCASPLAPRKAPFRGAKGDKRRHYHSCRP